MEANRAVRDVGQRVPEDISIIGPDNIASAAFFPPSLTTVEHPLREMGRSAAELLIECLRHPEATPSARVFHEPSLVVRKSTAPAPSPRTQAKAAVGSGEGRHDAG